MRFAGGSVIFLAALILLISGRASADFLEEFTRTRDFAQETLSVMRGVRESVPVDTSLLRGKSQTIGLDALIRQKAARHGIDPNFVRAVIAVESGYNPFARSPKGAMGLMQLMPATAAELGVANPWEPEENLEGGIYYLASLLSEFRDVKDALIAYNAGPEVVRKKLTVPQETKQYVRLVLTHFNRSFEKQEERKKRGS